MKKGKKKKRKEERIILERENRSNPQNMKIN
jgi:hypothetical protein